MSAILKALQNRKVEVELKSEVVEFGTLNDYTAHSKKIESFLKNYKKIVADAKKANDLLARAKKLNDEGYKLANDNTKIGKKFVAEYKALGLPMSGLKDVKAFRDGATLSAEVSKLNSELLKLIPR